MIDDNLLLTILFWILIYFSVLAITAILIGIGIINNRKITTNMEKRFGFISNSSSSSFIITNKTNKDLTLVDFVKENTQLVDEWNDMYDNENTFEELLKSAEENNFTFDANSSEEYVFGDESGTLIGRVFDYILRDGDESENFKWEFHEFYR